MLDVDKDKPENLIPVYDTDGNLLWPRKMTHEEVLQFVAERDTSKSNDEP